MELTVDNARICRADGERPTIDVATPDPASGGWHAVPEAISGQHVFKHRGRQLLAILTAAIHAEDTWIHLSVSHRVAVPCWDDLVFAKETLLGEHVRAIQVLPPRREWVNICERCLHLWVNLSREVLPDFTEGTGTL